MRAVSRVLDDESDTSFQTSVDLIDVAPKYKSSKRISRYSKFWIKTECSMGAGESITRHKKGPASIIDVRPLKFMARPEGFEPPTAWFVAKYD